jgi:hypothetical protein
MIVLLILLIFVILLAGWILFSTITIEIDSENNVYSIALCSMVQASVVTAPGTFLIRLRVFGLSFIINPLQIKPGKKEKSRPKKTKAISPFRMARIIRRIVVSFRLKLLKAEFDTGDYTLNAMLIPVFLQLKYLQNHVNVNFEDRNSIHIILQNRVFNFLRVFLFTH